MNNPVPSNPSPAQSSGWRILRRFLLALACFVTLIALFYTEEDLRGKAAWEQCTRDLEAKGINYQWTNLIPPTVPDDQNFFKAPGINEDDWIGRGTRPLGKTIENARGDAPTNKFLIAEVSIVSPSDSSAIPFDHANAALIFHRLTEALGAYSVSARQYLFSALPTTQIRPAHFNLSSPKNLISADIATLVPDRVAESLDHFLVESGGSNTFRIFLQSEPQSAIDFLARSSVFDSNLVTIRAALKRSFQRMDGGYSQPYNIPIPNFIVLRNLAQLLADRAKCHLLLRQPDEAVRNILLLHDICLVTESKPTGEPMTLVASMIHVAIIGLYADTIAEGFQTHSWSEQHLTTLQDQLAQTDLVPFLVTSFQDERASSATTLLQTSPLVIYNAIHYGANDAWTTRMKDLLYAFTTFAPRGWLYRNATLIFTLQSLDKIGDATNHLVSPAKAKQSQDENNIVSQSKSPHSILFGIFRPNGARAWQTLAYNQNLVDEALIACALERYRIAHQDYPETLDALVPQFIDKLPHDIIGGQPLHYTRQSNDTFLLYSVGWNETDDGGKPLDSLGNRSTDSPDWVWPNKNPPLGK